MLCFLGIHLHFNFLNQDEDDEEELVHLSPPPTLSITEEILEFINQSRAREGLAAIPYAMVRHFTVLSGAFRAFEEQPVPQRQLRIMNIMVIVKPCGIVHALLG